MSDAKLSERERALAQSNYDEPRWPLARALVWFANPKIEALAHYEATFLGRTLARIIKQQIAATAHNPDEVDELLGALKADKLRAIGPDNKPLPPEFWDDQSSLDPRTWPEARVRREDVLRERPGVEMPAGDASPQAAASKVAISRKRMSEPATKRDLPRFIRNHQKAEAAKGKRFHQDRAHVAAQDHFNKTIDRAAFRRLCSSLGVRGKVGRPPQIPPKS
jgi:hypothetical protein